MQNLISIEVGANPDGSPVKKALATICWVDDDRLLLSFDSLNNQLPRNFHECAVVSLATGSQLAGCSLDGWQSQSWSNPKLHAISPSRNLAASPAGDIVNPTIVLWDLNSGQQISVLKDIGQRINMCFMDEQTLVVASTDSSRRPPGFVTLYEMPSGKKLCQYLMPDYINNSPKSVAVSPDKSLVAAGVYQRVYAWDVNSGELVVDVKHPYEVRYLDMVDARLTSASYACSDAKQIQVKRTLPKAKKSENILFKEHTGGVHGLLVSPDGNTAISLANNDGVRIWDFHTGQEIEKRDESFGHYQGGFSPNGKRIAGMKGKLNSDRKTIGYELLAFDFELARVSLTV